MLEGEAYISVTVPSSGSILGGMIPMDTTGIGSIESSREARLRWREKTGEKKGFLIKSDEIRNFNIKGRRCILCGYIEFYVTK